MFSFIKQELTALRQILEKSPEAQAIMTIAEEDIQRIALAVLQQVKPELDALIVRLEGDVQPAQPASDPNAPTQIEVTQA